MDSRPSDESLLLAVAVRDLGAFRTLYERHAGWLAIRLARRCNDRDLVADAIQDTFVAVWQKPRGFRRDGDIVAWLWGIAIRWLGTRGSVAAVFEKAEAVPAAKVLLVEYGDIGQALVRHSPEMRAVIQAVLLDGLSAVRTFPAPGRLRAVPGPPVVDRSRPVRGGRRHFRSVAEGCPGGCPEFYDSGDIHCAGRPAAPATLLS